MFNEALLREAAELLEICRKKQLKIATAESCTGGLIAALFTEVPGSSDVFERGYVTYSNQSKSEMLAVDTALIAEHGAVSEEVAAAMVRGVLKKAGVGIALSVTGIAGPGGGSAQKPVGLVFIGVGIGENVMVKRHQFSGNRSGIRMQAVANALALLKTTVILA